MIIVTAFIFSAIAVSIINMVLISISAFHHQYLRYGVLGYFFCLLIIFAEHFIEYAGYSRELPFTIFISASFYLLLAPFLNVIVGSLFNREIIWKRFLIEIAPAIGYTILMIPFFMYPGDVKYRYLTNFLAENWEGSYKHLVLIGVLLLQTVIYSSIWYKQMYNYAEKVKSRASSADIEFIPWVSRLLVIMITFTFFMLLAWISRAFFPGNYYALDQIENVVLSIVPYAFLFLLFFLPEKPFPYLNKHSEENPKEFDPAHRDQLTELMDQEKLYLRPDLNLSDVAEVMKLSRQSLSGLLSQGFQKSFYDLVNEYRIAHAVKLMEGDSIKTLSLSGIARESGFNNYVSFYRVFKRLTQQTPSEYLKKKVQS